jgi:hypothetical protein
MAGETYPKRYGGGFSDVGGATPVDSQFLNEVEEALLRLLGEDPAADEVGVWVPGSNRFVFKKLTNANIDAAAAIDKAKLAALNIVNADIAAGAAIAKSKLAALNLTNADVDAAAAIVLSKLAITGSPDGTKFLRDDASWQAVPAPVTYRKVTEKDVTNTTTETDLLNGEITIGAGVMGTNKAVRVLIQGDYLQNMGGTAVHTIRIKFGGTTLWGQAVSDGAPGATRKNVRLEFVIQNLNANNVQFMLGRYAIAGGSASVAGIGTGEALVYTLGSNGTSALDTSTAKALEVTIAWDVASATRSWRLKSALVEVV